MQTGRVSRKTLQEVLDVVATSNGVGLTEIARTIGKSVSSVNVAVHILVRDGMISKGVQKKVLKTGELSDKLTPAYYYY